MVPTRISAVPIFLVAYAAIAAQSTTRDLTRVMLIDCSGPSSAYILKSSFRVRVSGWRPRIELSADTAARSGREGMLIRLHHSSSPCRMSRTEAGSKYGDHSTRQRLQYCLLSPR
jgi:hypothetical protein